MVASTASMALAPARSSSMPAARPTSPRSLAIMTGVIVRATPYSAVASEDAGPGGPGSTGADSDGENAKWQAPWCAGSPVATVRAGSSISHTGCAIGHLVRNRQPAGIRRPLGGHQDLGAQRQGPRDRHPLPLPAGELPRVGAQRVFPEPDQREQFLAVGLRRAVRNDVMHLEQLAEHAADGEPRVQRGVRVLEDHLDPPLVGARPAGPETPALAGDLATGGGAQARHGQPERRLARNPPPP